MRVCAASTGQAEPVTVRTEPDNSACIKHEGLNTNTSEEHMAQDTSEPHVGCVWGAPRPSTPQIQHNGLQKGNRSFQIMYLERSNPLMNADLSRWHIQQIEEEQGTPQAEIGHLL